MKQATKVLEDIIYNKTIIEVFESRKWGLYESNKEMDKMILGGREKKILDLNTQYVPLPLVENDKNIEEVKLYISECQTNERYPYFVTVEDNSEADNQFQCDITGVYLIDSILYDNEDLHLIIEKSVIKSVGLNPYINMLKNPNLVINRDYFHQMDKQIMKSRR